ncbi:MAG: hypothetical protein H6963_00870 [Chromatiaceae bacterium]|nr:hypothetical protein [Gammaproteobacteria bacterium]MCP5407837.1 hypothetical protein [Chromatiaceae bacterium]MCP5416709.1 hypothetical protein [Chromatiaceae bacterium]
MEKNSVQFQKGLSLAIFLNSYGTEQKCTEALFSWRWPSRLLTSLIYLDVADASRLEEVIATTPKIEN